MEQGNVDGQTDTAWAAFVPLQEVNTVYDSNARPVTTRLAAGGTTYAVSGTFYDSLGRVDCAVQRMDLSGFGLPAAVSCGAATGRIARTTYDALGRVYEQVSAYGTPEQATDATYAYTSNGQVQSVTDAEGNKTSYGYDGFDRRYATLYPNAAKGSNTSNSSDVELLTLDPNGNVTAFTNRAGQTIGMTYDALNRLTARDLPDSGAYVYDDYYSYDNLGRLKTASADPVNPLITFTWDALGRLKKDEHSTFGAKTFDYDLAGRRIGMTWPDGFHIDYQYFVTGEMAYIRENGASSGVGVLAAFGYDDLGRRTSLLRGNGTSTTYTPDPVSRLSALALTFPADPSKTLPLSFTYNAAFQIVRNDRDNDLYSWTGHGNGNTVSTVNGLNQLSPPGTPWYDTKGNMTFDGTSSYTYASDNRLASGKGLALIYDPLGRLTWIQNQGRVADYSGTDLVSELAVNSYAVQRRFVYGPGSDEPLVWYEGPGTSDRRFLHADERGSIVAISNGSGLVTTVNTYDEYGKPGAGNVGRFQYTGQKWYAALGLYDYKARMYHPTLGRFMQTDPIGFGGGLNLYGYVGGDPVNFLDPGGTQATSSDIVVTGGFSCAFDWENWDKASRSCVSSGRELLPRMFFDYHNYGGGGGGRKDRGSSGGPPPPPPPPPQNEKQCPAPPTPGPGKKELDRSIRDSQRSFAERSRFGSALDFANSVKPGGQYDWKLRIKGSASFGNFAYGATGRAQGYSLGKLQTMATLVQAFDDIRHFDFDGFGDNTGDADEIAAGAAYYDRGCYQK